MSAENVIIMENENVAKGKRKKQQSFRPNHIRCLSYSKEIAGRSGPVVGLRMQVASATRWRQQQQQQPLRSAEESVGRAQRATQSAGKKGEAREEGSYSGSVTEAGASDEQTYRAVSAQLVNQLLKTLCG